MNRIYSQPDFYHFNSDSIDLIHWISQRKINSEHILDLGTGSGIIGIELALIQKIKKLTLVELQRDYEPHLQMNLNRFLPSHIDVDIHWTSFSDFKIDHSFDLIVCNPPYYLPGHGQVSKDLKRMMARSFVMGSWGDIFSIINLYMSTNGIAVFVLKKDKIILKSMLKELETFPLISQIHEKIDIVFLEIFRLNKNRD